MKIARFVILASLIFVYAMPLPVLALQSATETFVLPEGTAGGAYQSSIPTVLREKYQLKLQSGANASIFRWAFVGGDMPPGLIVRPNGTITGIPRVPRDEPYRFQVKVLDLAYGGSEALRLDLEITIIPHRIRLTKVLTPRLTPLDSEQIDQNSPIDNSAANTAQATPARNSHASFFQSSPNAVEPDSTQNRVQPAAVWSMPRANMAQNSPAVLRDTSYDTALIKPVLSTLRVAPPTPIPALPNNDKKYKVDPSKEKASGDKIRGPAKIELKNLNILRYDIRVGKDVTFPAAPDLKLPFIPPIPNQPSNASGAPKAATASHNDPIPDRFDNQIAELDSIESDKATRVNSEIVGAINATNLATSDLVALVSASDSILNTGGGASAVISGVRSLIEPSGAGAISEIDDALTRVWPDAEIESLLGRLDLLKNSLATLPTTYVPAGKTSWDNWYRGGNKASYDFAVARVTELQNQLNSLKSSGTQGTAFQQAQSKLRQWKPILIGVRDGGLSGFDRTVEVGCGFAFDTGKETKIKMIKRDRLAEPGAGATEEEVVTVVCSSPLSISAGFGFSNLDEKEFVFVPSTKSVTSNGQTTQTVISRFGFRSKSAFRTLPVLLLNTRVWEPNDTFALHVSTGAAVDVKTGQGGTDLEYIVGPSFSFWRSLFITPGLHIGRVNKLAGGFELDQEVPTGISEPPLEKAWKKGFVTTFTYKIK